MLAVNLLTNYARNLIVRKESGEVIAADLADRLREPVDGEAELVAALAKTGADEDELDALAGAVRLLDSVGADVTTSTSTSTSIAKAETPKLTLNSPEERRRLAEEARRTNERIQRFAKEAQVKKAELAKPKRSAAESLVEVMAIEKSIQVRDDAHAMERLEKSAGHIRRTNPNLSKADAMVKALNDSPEEYAAHVRHQSRQAGFLDDGPDTIRKAAAVESELDRAAQPFLKADPSLSRAQAVVKALHADPTLFERTR